MEEEKIMNVYIMASESGTLYVGVTSDIERRVWEHKNDFKKGFSSKYKCHKLVYFEELEGPLEAIAREKQIKKWRREKKQDLIASNNPTWKDLSEDWKPI